MPQLHQAEAQKLDQLVFPDQQTAPSARGLQAVRVGRAGTSEKNGSRKHERVSDLIANPSYCMVAGARNHLQANYRSVAFRLEIQA